MEIQEHEWKGRFSEREKKFLMALAKTGDPGVSLGIAGYTGTSLSYMAEKILKRKEAKEELQLLKGEVAAQNGDIPAEEIIDGFRRIAEANITDFYDENGDVIDVTQMDRRLTHAIKEIKRTVNPKTGHVTVVLTMHDKVSALQNLGRIGGHYAADNGQTQGDVNIQINLPGDLALI